MRFDRRVTGAVAFPADYGFIPQTCSDDGDPLDALVLLEEPTFPGIGVLTRPIGVCWTDATKYQEPKIICVPVNDPSYAGVRDLGDLADVVRDEIQQFFNVYKDFDDGHDSRFMRSKTTTQPRQSFATPHVTPFVTRGIDPPRN